MKHTVPNAAVILTILLLLSAFPLVAKAADILRGQIVQAYTADTVPLATLRADFPQFGGIDETGVKEKVNAAIRAFIMAESGYDFTCANALADFSNGHPYFSMTDYGVDAKADAVLYTGRWLVVRYDFLAETGGPHPWETIAAQHFDLSTGEAVPLTALAGDIEMLHLRVTERLLQAITQMGPELFADAEDQVRAWPFENAMLTTEGLLVFFNEGEIGPVAANAFEFLIPYEQLAEARFVFFSGD